MKYEEKILLENKYMKLNLILLVFMSFGGISLGSLANSEAIKFDGLFSLVTLLTVLVGIHISKTTLELPNRYYPLGKYQYSDIFTLLKTFTLLFLVSYSLIDAFSSIIDYYVYGIQKEEVIFYWANIYYGMMLFVKISSIMLYKYGKDKLKNSALMKEEMLSSIIDGLLTLSVFVGLTLFTRIKFIEAVADDIVLLIISIFLIQLLLRELIELMSKIVGKNEFNALEKEIKDKLNSIDGIICKSVYIKSIGENYEYIIVCDSNEKIKEKTKEIKDFINKEDNRAVVEVLWGE